MTPPDDVSNGVGETGRSPGHDRSSVAVFCGVDNTITDADDAFLDILGLDRATFDRWRLEGRSLSPPDSVEFDLAALRLAAASGSAAPYLKHFLHRDGRRLPVLISLWVSDEGPGHWLAYAVDLSAEFASWTGPIAPAAGTATQPAGHTDRLVGELVAERSRIVAMLDGTNALIWAADRDLRLLGSNRAFQHAQRRRTGRTLHVGDPVLDPAFDVDERADWETWYRQALRGERLHHRLETDEGRVVDLRCSPMRAVGGHIVGAAVVGTDVTAEHRANIELLRRENLLRIAGRLGKVAAWTIDRRTLQVTLSDEMTELLDAPGPQVVPLEESIRFYPRDRRVGMRALVQRCLTEGEPFDVEVPATTSTGREVWLRVMAEPERDASGEVIGLHGAVADLTEVRESRRKLREQAGLLDNATDAILVRDLEGRVTFWNRAAQAMYGWTAHEAVGRHIADLVDGGDMDKFHAMEEILWRDGEWSGRIDNVDRNGHHVVIELHVNVIRDELGHPTAVFSVASDVTERVQLEERLALSQKLESVGQLTGGLAHDFNNLLTVILGSSELIADAAADHPEIASLAEMITGAAQRGAELTSRLLAFARRQPLQPSVVDPLDAAREVIELLTRSLPESITIELAAEHAGRHVSIDPGQLEAALMNLALNARDAMLDGGRLTISIDTTELVDEPQLGVEGGRYVRIAVSDTGTGIPDEFRERVFDPFFTTKDPGKGSGLGLSMVYGFINQSGGHVELRSEMGAGTTIELLLPQADPDSTPRPHEPRSTDELPGGSERVLVVEDEPMVRQQAVAVLGALGYRVSEAENAADALDRVVDDTGRLQVDLVFSDVVMPGGMNGIELAHRLSEQFPTLAVLLTSGYTEPAEQTTDERLELLQKPYRRADLAAAVRRALAASTSAG